MESTGGGDVRGVGIEKLYLLIIVIVAIDNELRALWSGRQFLLGVSLGCRGALSLLLRWLLILLLIVVVIVIVIFIPTGYSTLLIPRTSSMPLASVAALSCSSLLPTFGPSSHFPLV